MNETARELLRSGFNNGKRLIDITLTEDQAVAFAEAYHASQMSVIAQRAAEKILAHLAEFGQHDLGSCQSCKQNVAAIIEQEGR